MADTMPTRHASGARYPAEVREQAYQLWAWKHGHNCAAVARALLADDEMKPLLGHTNEAALTRVVQQWAVTEKWAERAHDEFRSIAPGLHRAVATGLAAAAPEAIQVLREVARGESPDPRRDRVRVAAAVAVLDRAGYTPHLVTQRQGGTQAPDLPMLGADTFTTEQLADFVWKVISQGDDVVEVVEE